MSVHRATLRVATARPWLTAVVVVVIAGGLLGYFLVTGGGGSSSAATGSSTTQLVSVTTGTVSESISTTGDLTPTIDKNVSFASAATITSVRVTEGDTVKKGQVLGTIGTLSLKATLASNRSTLATARSTLASAVDDDQTTSAQLAADKTQVATAKAAVTSSKKALTDAVLRSPVAGLVAAVNVERGDQSSGSSSADDSSAGSPSAGSSSSQTLDGSTSSTSSGSSSSGDFQIIGTHKWKVSVDVDDTQVGEIEKGQQAQLTTDNHNGTIFGTVSSVSVLSSSDSGSAKYPVIVTVTGSPSGLHDGAEATVKIIYRQAADVLTVPTLALHRDSTSTYVYLDSQGNKTKQIVKTGVTDGTTTQVTAGLRSGERVYEQVLSLRGRSGSSATSGERGSNGEFPGGGSAGFPGGGSGGGFGAGGGFGGGGFGGSN